MTPASGRAFRTRAVRWAVLAFAGLWLLSSLCHSLPLAARAAHRAALARHPQSDEIASGAPAAGALLDVAAGVPPAARVSLAWDQPPDSYPYYWVSYWLAPRPVTVDTLPPAASYVLVLREGGEPPPRIGSRRLVRAARSGLTQLAMYGPASR